MKKLIVKYLKVIYQFNRNIFVILRAQPTKNKNAKKYKRKKRNTYKNRFYYKPKPILVNGKELCRKYCNNQCNLIDPLIRKTKKLKSDNNDEHENNSLKECKYSHDIKGYWNARIKQQDQEQQENETICPNFLTFGYCPSGITCIYAKSHTNFDTFEQIILKDDKKESPNGHGFKQEMNQILYQLKRNEYKYDANTTNIINIMNNWRDNALYTQEKEKLHQELKESSSFNNNPNNSNINEWNLNDMLFTNTTKEINWKDKVYLAPLTTVGNLPFRRVCKNFGVDITCGEMAIASNIIQAQVSEWALLKRHKSEDIYGVQIAVKHIDNAAKVCSLIKDYVDCDFVDLNVGCPIDLICNKGMGSKLMTRPVRLWDLGKTMSLSLYNSPIATTIKMRKGWNENSINANEIISSLSYSGFSSFAIHGRTRQQRYTKRADWNYIQSLGQHHQTIIGNGDIFTVHDYNRAKEKNIETVMVARGALIKPWIFTEIKEQKDWDITSSERFEFLKDFTNYGLEHWGSDRSGVERTRKFLLEWLSFLWRYVPIGIQERPISYSLNLRPYNYVGRNDLETLFASKHSDDWIRITEMLLGKVPNDYNFTPKHISNSWQ